MESDLATMRINFSSFSVNSNQFVLPAGFNEGTERIIALTAGSRVYDNSSLSPIPRNDYHFYLRNGNKSCPSAGNGHGSNCSIWSHKPGLSEVTCEINGTLLCDNNIKTVAPSLTIHDDFGAYCNYSEPLRFYRIGQDTNVYNSWYTIGSGISYAN